MITICSQFLCNIKVPFPVYSRSGGFSTSRLPVFRLFPVSAIFIIIIIIMAFSPRGEHGHQLFSSRLSILHAYPVSSGSLCFLARVKSYLYLFSLNRFYVSLSRPIFFFHISSVLAISSSPILSIHYATIFIHFLLHICSLISLLIVARFPISSTSTNYHIKPSIYSCMEPTNCNPPPTHLFLSYTFFPSMQTYGFFFRLSLQLWLVGYSAPSLQQLMFSMLTLAQGQTSTRPCCQNHLGLDFHIQVKGNSRIKFKTFCSFVSLRSSHSVK